MKKEEIHFGDINRWLFGQAPPEFMLEVFIRTVLIYAFLLLAVRLMGKRMTGQINLTELAVMVTLGAIVSPVMQLPDRGLVFGIIGLICALLFQKGITLLTVKSPAVEEAVEGRMTLLVSDGRLMLPELEKANISRQQLFAMLRQKNIEQLGKVKRAYLEACGLLSIYQTMEERPGLPIFPPSDPDIAHSLPEADASLLACQNCGVVQHATDDRGRCTRCGDQRWTKARLSPKNES